MLSFNQKQNFLYLTFIVITIIVSIFAYHATQKKWLIYHSAENQFHQNNYAEAIDLYKQSLELGESSDFVYLHLADSYVAVGNFPQGIHYYRLFLNKHPKDAEVRRLLARALSWNGNIKEAEQEYRYLLEESHEKETH